ncbi:acyltransferase [bacterium]|nr:acyltransferase [bacterium]
MKNVKLRFTGKNNIVELPNSHFCALFNIQEDNSYIKIGKNFSANDVTFRLIEGNSTVIIGDDCMFSCNIDILSSDGHVIMRKGEVRPYNQPKPVIIGNHVWVGYNVKILKGTEIADNTILGACSVVSGKFNEPNVIIAGNPARVVKQDIDWNSLPHVMYNATLEKMLVGACN